MEFTNLDQDGTTSAIICVRVLRILASIRTGHRFQLKYGGKSRAHLCYAYYKGKLHTYMVGYTWWPGKLIGSFVQAERKVMMGKSSYREF